MTTKKTAKVSTAADAVAKFKAALKGWLKTRTEIISTEEDVRGGAFAEAWHDERGPFPVKQARALERACELLAEHGRQAGLDVQPAFRLAVDMRSSRYTSDAVLADAEALAKTLASRCSITTASVDESATVSFNEALEGSTELSLPKTPETTLRRWHKDPEAARDLDVDPKAKASLQRFRVVGLLRLHKRKEGNRSRPPQTRADQGKGSRGSKRG